MALDEDHGEWSSKCICCECTYNQPAMSMAFSFAFTISQAAPSVIIPNMYLHFREKQEETNKAWIRDSLLSHLHDVFYSINSPIRPPRNTIPLPSFLPSFILYNAKHDKECLHEGATAAFVVQYKRSNQNFRSRRPVLGQLCLTTSAEPKATE